MSGEGVTRIRLIRHADVENPDGVLYGHLPGFGLSRRGRAQAKALGESLRDAGLVRIVHSPLQRAVETATIMAAELTPSPELVADPELREAEFSRHLQGVRYWQIPVLRPRWYIHKFRRGFLEGDEPYEDLGGRVLAVARALAVEYPEQAAAVVSHADPLQAAWLLLDRRPHNEREMVRKPVDKAGSLVVDFRGAEPVSWTYVPPPAVNG